MVFNRAFTRSTLNSTNALEGNAFASFLLGAPSSGNVDVNPKPHYQWFFTAPWIQDDWRVTKMDEPRLPLGHQRVRDGRGQHAELRVRPDDRQPGVGARRSAGDGWHQVRRRDGAPDRPWKLENNYQVRVGTAYSLNEKTAAPGRLRQALPQPDESRQQRRIQPLDADHRLD